MVCAHIWIDKGRCGSIRESVAYKQCEPLFPHLYGKVIGMGSCASTGRAGTSLSGAGVSTQLSLILHLVGSGLWHLP